MLKMFQHIHDGNLALIKDRDYDITPVINAHKKLIDSVKALFNTRTQPEPSNDKTISSTFELALSHYNSTVQKALEI